MAARNGPGWDMQQAMQAVLAGHADIKSLLGDPPRIYEDVPQNAALPYVTAGENQIVPDLAECIDGSLVFSTFHIWSKASSFQECNSIAATITAVLADATLTLAETRLIDFARESWTILRDPDGVTRHGVLTVKATTEPL